MATSFPILTFHAVDEQPSIISFSPQRFQHGMARLHEDGYRTVSLPALVDCLHRGAPFPQRSLAITFDDGYQSVYEHAFPILQRYGFSATVFLTVGENVHGHETERLPAMEGRSMLSWHEIKEMHRCGMTFGAHTLTHPDLTRLAPQCIDREISDSKARIENALGTAVLSFAYPFGRYDSQSRDIAGQHFACACSDKLGLVTAGSDLFALERVDAYYLHGNRLLALLPSRFFNWYVRARRVPRGIRRALVAVQQGRPAASLPHD